MCTLIESTQRDVDALPGAESTFDGVEAHHPIDKREKGVVGSFANIDAGQHGSSPLADENRAGVYSLTSIGLHPKTLGIGVASVTS